MTNFLRKYFPIYIAFHVTFYYLWVFQYNPLGFSSFLSTLIGNVISISAVFIASILLAFAYFRNKKEQRNVWLFLLLGTLSYFLAEFIWIYYENIRKVEVPFPGWPGLFYMLKIILFLIALGFYTLNASKGMLKLRALRLFFDLCIVMTVAITFSLHFLISPVFDWLDVSIFYKVVLVGYPVGDLALIFGVTLIYFQFPQQHFKHFQNFFAIALLFRILSNSLYFYLMLYGTYESSNFINPIYSLGILIIGYASLYPLYTGDDRDTKERRVMFNDRIRLLLPYMSVALLIIILLQQTAEMTGLIIGATIAIVLIIVRQIITLLENQKLVEELKLLSSELEKKVKERTEELFQKNNELVETLKQVEFIANHDSLTNLPNRRQFEAILSGVLEEAKATNKLIAVLFVDLDRFKNINDSLGHAVGDKILQLTANRLSYLLNKGDIVSRQGGDEFTIMLKDHVAVGTISKKVVQIERAIRNPFVIQEHDFYITPSIGVAIFPHDGTNVATLMKHADIAMYRAKEQGKNQSCYFSEEMNGIVLKKIQIETELNKALLNDEFEVYYQPQFEVATRTLTGAEALIRWNHPNRGIVSPGEFIDIAEESSLIVPIGEFVLREACKQMKNWNEKYNQSFRISVNLSPKQFTEQGMIKKIQTTIENVGINPDLVMLEITENIALYNEDEVNKKLQQIKKIGMKVAIDDFGTGYSSLMYLKKFPINTLKIAQTFVVDCDPNSDVTTIIQAIIAMGRSLKLHVIAEGVETEEQLTFLRELDCDEVQGYLFGRPVNATDFERLYLGED